MRVSLERACFAPAEKKSTGSKVCAVILSFWWVPNPTNPAIEPNEKRSVPHPSGLLIPLSKTVRHQRQSMCVQNEITR